MSVPCLERFEAQKYSYRAHILSTNQPIVRVSIEAGVTKGWRAVLGPEALTYGVDRFGASAPAGDLYHFFGLEPVAIVKDIMSFMNKNASQKA